MLFTKKDEQQKKYLKCPKLLGKRPISMSSLVAANAFIHHMWWQANNMQCIH